MDHESFFGTSARRDEHAFEDEAFEFERGRGGFGARGASPMRSAGSRAMPRGPVRTKPPRARPPAPQPRPRPGWPRGGTTVVGGWPPWPASADARDGDDADRGVEPAEPPSEFVRWVQSALNRAEGRRLPVTGVMDAAARSALRRFQRAEGLPADGFAGPDTVQALRRSRSDAGGASRDDRRNASAGRRRSAAQGEAAAGATLDRSSRAYSAWLQGALNRALGLRLATDGIVGPLTRAAVRDFQTRQGLVPSGLSGADVDAALMRTGAPPPPPASAPVARPLVPAGRTASIGTRFITVASRALLTPPIEAAAKALDAHFERAGLAVALTSALRPPQDQLRLIREQAVKRGIDRQHPSIHTATVENVDSWLGAWDELLHTHKYVINPPVAATSRITGKRYSASPHTTGLAFDLSGGDLDRIAAAVAGWCREGGAVRQILIERRNNAVHVGLDADGRSGACAVSVSN